MALKKNYGSMASAQHAYDNAVNPADEERSVWESVTQDEIESAKAEFFATGTTAIQGIHVFTDSTPELEAMIAKYDDELGDDWMLNAVDLPYNVKLHEAKEKVWDLACDHIDAEAGESTTDDYYELLGA